MSDFHDPGGIVVPATSLQIPRGHALAELLGSRRLHYVELIECRSVSGDDVVVFDVEIERPQHLKRDIRRIERIAAVFARDDRFYPQVLALRADFPNVPHLNLTPKGSPCSLCLYEEPWDQIVLHWTPTAFIERIRFWLAETAKATLHQHDQPLEPLLFGSGYRIVLPADLFSTTKADEPETLDVFSMESAADDRLLFAVRPPPSQNHAEAEFVAVSLTAEPQSHGAIRHTPRNLRDLHEFLLPCGLNLIQDLRQRVLSCYQRKEHQNKKLILVVAFPRGRDDETIIETTDVWVFLAGATLPDIGVALGVLAKVDIKPGYGMISGTPAPGADGTDVAVDVILPIFDLSRESAARSSGFHADDRTVLAVGVGALGSQVVDLLARAGFGKWTLVDQDVLLPHNLARHALRASALGWPKAARLAQEIDNYYEEPQKTAWHKANALDTSDSHEKLLPALSAAKLILDSSASVSVARHLALDVDASARRISIFLNPTGTDLVMLAEDEERQIRLDCLELQYYRAVACQAELANHLSTPKDAIRYSRSCRDVTAQIPNHLVTLHAAIAANAVRRAANLPDPVIEIWRATPDMLAVTHTKTRPSPVQAHHLGRWTLVVDAHLQARLTDLRECKLPNETGGVLIGAYDFPRQIVYVVDTIPSPPDSEEWPTLYIRGAAGLAQQVQRISAVTDGRLGYVGEWHSHPDKCSCQPSDDDLKVFTWLTETLADDGKPSLMAIVGEHRTSAWFLGEMLRSGGWEVQAPLDQTGTGVMGTQG